MTPIDQRFGADLRLTAAGPGLRDVQVVASGDLGTVDGPDAAVQALTLRLLVRRGELGPLGWPDYGSRLHELIGEPDVPRTRLRLAQYARAAIADDWRVQEVAELAVSTNRFEARIDLQVVLASTPDPLRLTVSVPLEAS